MGATTQSREGLVAIMFYLVTYCFMNLGAFWVASKVDDSLGGDQLRHFRGLGTRAPWFAAAMAIFVVSLIGIPPLSGFVATTPSRKRNAASRRPTPTGPANK
jgi:NADH-quinone oxidoreductase subunit N